MSARTATAGTLKGSHSAGRRGPHVPTKTRASCSRPAGLKGASCQPLNRFPPSPADVSACRMS